MKVQRFLFVSLLIQFSLESYSQKNGVPEKIWGGSAYYLDRNQVQYALPTTLKFVTHEEGECLNCLYPRNYRGVKYAFGHYINRLIPYCKHGILNIGIQE